jgi:hypothetical protein
VAHLFSFAIPYERDWSGALPAMKRDARREPRVRVSAC